MIGIKRFLKGKKNIFDIGCGDMGSDWWKKIDKNAKITGIELNFFPKFLPSNVKVYKLDADRLVEINKLQTVSRLNTGLGKILQGQFNDEKVDWDNKFDMVVVNHVLEHVKSPENTIKGIGKIIKKEGVVYAGFPDSKNFTDIFYHLIHAEGGGHIQKLDKKSVTDLFKKHGFKLISCDIWPDDWVWFEKLFDFKGRNIKFIDQSEISYLARIFRKELSTKKGYFYGWEMIFKRL